MAILGLLTYNISKNTNEENKNNSFLLKRIESYDSLAYFLTEVFTAVDTITVKAFKLRKGRLTNEMINTIKNDLEKDAKIFLQFYSLVMTFEQRYSYLYNYDFSSPEFQQLIDEAEKFTVFIDALINKDDSEIVEFHDPKVIKILYDILEKLQSELK